MPSGRSTRATSAKNSRVARCQGTERLPNASPITTSALSSSKDRGGDAPVAGDDRRVGQSELVVDQVDQVGVDLEHGLL